MWAGFNKAWRSVLLALPVWTRQWYARSLTLSAQSPASGGRTRPPFLSEVSAICFSFCHFWHQQPQNGDHLTWDQLIGIQIIFSVQHHLLDFRLDWQDRDPTSEDIFLWIVIDLKFTPRNEVKVCIYEGFVWRKFVKTAQFVLNLRAIKREKQLWRQNIAMQQRMKISSERRREDGGGSNQVVTRTSPPPCGLLQHVGLLLIYWLSPLLWGGSHFFVNLLIYFQQ